MRRRIRSAALPLHRHALPQLAVDGALVALAYYLAFQLRFDSGPPGPYARLRSDTILWVALGSLPVLVLARVYQKDAGVGTVIALMLPYVIALFIVWPILLAVWHVLGLPWGV